MWIAARPAAFLAGSTLHRLSRSALPCLANAFSRLLISSVATRAAIFDPMRDSSGAARGSALILLHQGDCPAPAAASVLLARLATFAPALLYSGASTRYLSHRFSPRYPGVTFLALTQKCPGCGKSVRVKVARQVSREVEDLKNDQGTWVRTKPTQGSAAGRLTSLDRTNSRRQPRPGREQEPRAVRKGDAAGPVPVRRAGAVQPPLPADPRGRGARGGVSRGRPDIPVTVRVR